MARQILKRGKKSRLATIERFNVTVQKIKILKLVPEVLYSCISQNPSSQVPVLLLRKKKKRELEVQKNPILQRLKSSVWERENREGKEQDKKVYQIYT